MDLLQLAAASSDDEFEEEEDDDDVDDDDVTTPPPRQQHQHTAAPSGIEAISPVVSDAVSQKQTAATKKNKKMPSISDAKPGRRGRRFDADGRRHGLAVLAVFFFRYSLVYCSTKMYKS
jgi:hypothetical protein